MESCKYKTKISTSPPRHRCFKSESEAFIAFYHLSQGMNTNHLRYKRFATSDSNDIHCIASSYGV